MTFSDLIKQEHISPTYRDIAVLQKFYQEGYLQGVHDVNPNYEYAIKYQNVVERINALFADTTSPMGLEKLEKCLDAMDNFKKKNLMS